MVKPGRKSRAESRYTGEADRLAQLVKAARNGADLSQEDAANLADVSASWLSKLERGAVVEPGLFPVLALLQALEIADVAEVLRGITPEWPAAVR